MVAQENTTHPRTNFDMTASPANDSEMPLLPTVFRSGGAGHVQNFSSGHKRTLIGLSSFY